MPKSINVGRSPKIRIDTIDGDLSIVGWDGADLLIKGDEEEIRFKQTDEAFSVSSGGDLSLRVPKAASFDIKMISGDASVRGLTGDFQLKEIGGDLSIRDGGTITIDTIHADFSLRGAKGSLWVKNSHSDVSIRDVEGSVTLDSVADDLALRGARGNIKVNVGEDVVLYLEPKADGEYSVTAGEGILLVLPPNANATVSMQGDEIDVDWQGVENDEDETERVVVLGDGSAKITLQAGGDVRLTDRVNAAESADEFGNFAGLDFDWSGFGERISHQVEQATARAAKRAEEAARRVERHARRFRGGLELGRWNFDPGSKGPPKTPSPPSEPVSDDERLAILKMLAEKKITADQAEQLLAALEGGK